MRTRTQPRRRTWRSRPLSYVRVRVTLAALLAALLAAVLGTLLFLTSLRTALVNQLITSAQQQVGVVAAQLKGGESPAQVVADRQERHRDPDPRRDRQHRGLRPPARDHAAAQHPGTSSAVHVRRLIDEYVVVAGPTPKPGA